MRRSISFPSRFSCAAIVVSALAFGLTGCGGEDTHDLSGKVTFNGQPVPAGKIYFIPDSSKGNTGQTGYANIENGAYDTSSTGGKAFSSGAVTVTIEAWDPSAAGKKKPGDTSGEQTVKALFPQFEQKVEIPSSESTRDFDVPASAAKRRVVGEEAGQGYINP